MEKIYGYVVVIDSKIQTEKASVKERHVFLPLQKNDAQKFARESVNLGYKVSFETLIAHCSEEEWSKNESPR